MGPFTLFSLGTVLTNLATWPQERRTVARALYDQ